MIVRYRNTLTYLLTGVCPFRTAHQDSEKRSSGRCSNEAKAQGCQLLGGNGQRRFAVGRILLICCYWLSVRFVVDSRQPANNKAGCMGHILQHGRVGLMLHVFYQFCFFLPFLTVFKNLIVFLVDVFACMTVCVCTELYVLLPLWRNKT